MNNGADKGVELLKCLIRGGEKAVAEFGVLTGGEWFDAAPEYFLTTFLASSLRKLEKTYVMLEVGIDKTLSEAGAKRLEDPTTGDKRRFDLVVYSAGGNPRGAIEVKSPIHVVDSKKLNSDFERLCNSISVNNDSSFQFCAFFYYASVSKPKRIHDNSSEKLRELVDKIYAKADKYAKEFDLVATPWSGSIRRSKEGDDCAWCVTAIVFTRKGGERYFRRQ